ncbi:hypothetical protein NPIL_61111 [Nephila pilipes]|uniref:Uncharacterized protein n=1 Tax=Nephila pilipes TaxID=299642 RepID=A0A8X6NNY0_NEPPI|nr:hypothetical protein NPIL_61111 [Nephila pilipes]
MLPYLLLLSITIKVWEEMMFWINFYHPTDPSSEIKKMVPEFICKSSKYIAVTASWIIYGDIHGMNSMPHLEFRRDITLNLLRSQPKLISQPGPKIHVPTEIRKADNYFLKSYAACQKKLLQHVC